MIEVGKYNVLRIGRFTDYGAYLVATETKTRHRAQEKAPAEVLLPARYITENMHEGDDVEVFVYTDSEDRPVATTEHPFAIAGQFAFLQVSEVNRIGAFLDWGLVAKQLLVPFSEQKTKMRPGGIYPVYVYVDHVTGRVVASAKIEKFMGNVFPDYSNGNKVGILAYRHSEMGYDVIVDNLHKGFIYNNETHQPIELGTPLTAYVKKIREDGKIDLTLTAPGTVGRVDKVSAEILKQLKQGTFALTDNSTPEAVEAALHCSKKDFKKAVGALYKTQKISIDRATGVITTAN